MLPGLLPDLRAAYSVFFLGTALAGFGSAWYHLAPSNATLVWDRLPMTLAFMAFSCIIVGEHVSPGLGRTLLLPFLLLGVASVAYWYVTEMRGAGDLRLYILVQYLPVIGLPLLMALRPSRLTRPHLLWSVLAAYGCAKLFELLDDPIYRWIGVSGHTLEHPAAAFGIYPVILALSSRALHRPDQGA